MKAKRRDARAQRNALVRNIARIAGITEAEARDAIAQLTAAGHVEAVDDGRLRIVDPTCSVERGKLAS